MTSIGALLINAVRPWPYAPVSLPRKEFMDRSKSIWEELGLPSLKPRMPWYGYNLGAWTKQDEQEAELAVKGEYFVTGDKQKEKTSHNGASWPATRETRRSRVVSLVTVFVLVTCHLSLATVSTLAQSQTTGRISGAVKDQAGAAIAGAEVRAVNRATISERTAITDGDGSYMIPFLPPWYEPKKNALSVLMGPPMSPPKTFRLSTGRSTPAAFRNGLLAFKASSRKYS